ncbi:MAG: carbohydrate kinase [Treponema sp.]|nr:carbohydrate kinase [Treponema sp.]
MYLCVGEAVIDMFLHDDVFKPLPGGCSYNTSIAIARLNSKASFFGRLSKNFFGDIQVKRLQENNVNVDLLIRSNENPILAFIKTEKDGQPQYAFYDEGTVDRLLSIEELPSVPIETKCIIFGSVSMTMEPIATAIETLIQKEAAKKTVISFDPNIRPYFIKDRETYIERFKKLASICTIVKISNEDFEYVFPGLKPEEALEKMLTLGTDLAIITLGHEGSMAMLRCENGSVIKACAQGVQIPKIADTVGAGDTFHGAFLVRLEQMGKLSHNAIVNLNEADLYDALSYANKAAAFVCTRYGAEPPTLEEMDKKISV